MPNVLLTPILRPLLCSLRPSVVPPSLSVVHCLVDGLQSVVVMGKYDRLDQRTREYGCNLICNSVEAGPTTKDVTSSKRPGLDKKVLKCNPVVLASLVQHTVTADFECLVGLSKKTAFAVFDHFDVCKHVVLVEVGKGFKPLRNAVLLEGSWRLTQIFEFDDRGGHTAL